MKIDNHPDVSIYVMTYFHEKYIEQALGSILCQITSYTYEIIISDDCSQDRTPEILLRYANDHPEVIRVILNESNLGISKNKYQVLSQCRGRYITGLSGDDYWIDNHSLQKRVDFLESHPEYFAVTGAIELRYDDEDYGVARYPSRKFISKDITLDDFLGKKGVPLYTHSLLARNALLSKTGRDMYSLIPKVSASIDDTTECILVLTLGNVYTMDICPVVHRIHRDKKGHNNFTSTNTALSTYSKMVALYNNIPVYFHQELDLFWLYRSSTSSALLYALSKRKLNEFRRIYASVPNSYRRRGLICSALPMMCKIGLAYLHRKRQKK